MRRTAALIGGLFVVGSLAACGSDSDESVETETTAPVASDVSEPPVSTADDGLDLTVEFVVPEPVPVNATGPFTASGSAVDAGWFCADGTYTELSYQPVQAQYGAEVSTMLLDCTDLDGSVTLSIEGQGRDTSTGWYVDVTWTVVDPDGSLAGATGSGDGSYDCDATECLGQYVGRLLVEQA